MRRRGMSTFGHCSLSLGAGRLGGGLLLQTRSFPSAVGHEGGDPTADGLSYVADSCDGHVDDRLVGVKRANRDALDWITANGNGVRPICRSSQSLSTSVLMSLGDVRLLHLW